MDEERIKRDIEVINFWDGYLQELAGRVGSDTETVYRLYLLSMIAAWSKYTEKLARDADSTAELQRKIYEKFLVDEDGDAWQG